MNQRDLRTATALACNVPRLLLELDIDGRCARVSHERAFVPVMPPCLLRAAIIGSGPGWLTRIDGCRLLGPFVDLTPTESGCVIASWQSDDRAHAAFAVIGHQAEIATALRTFDAGDVDVDTIDGLLRVDTALGTGTTTLTAVLEDDIDLVDLSCRIAKALSMSRLHSCIGTDSATSEYGDN